MFLVASIYIAYHKTKYLWFIPYGISFSVLCFFLGWVLSFIVIAVTKTAAKEVIFILIFHAFFCILFARYFLKKKYKEINRTNFIMLSMFSVSLFIVIYSVLMFFLFSWILGYDFVSKNLGFVIWDIITKKPY